MAILHPGRTISVRDLPQRYQPSTTVLLAANVAAAQAPAAVMVEPVSASVAAAADDIPAQAEVSAALPASAEDSLVTQDRLPEDGIDLREHMARIELNLIRDALERAGGVVAHAAQLLGLRRTTLVEKLRKYGVERDEAALLPET